MVGVGKRVEVKVGLRVSAQVKAGQRGRVKGGAQ